MSVEPLELVPEILSPAGPAGVGSRHSEVSGAEADGTTGGVGGAAGWGNADGDATGEVEG